MSLASIEDYTLRHGAPADEAQAAALLDDASSLVRSYGGHISLVTADEITLDSEGGRRLFLPERPVVEVSEVTVDGTLLDPGDYQAWRWGGLDRRDGQCWPCAPQSVDVTYTHGGNVPDWVVNLVCAMVQRALRPQASTGEQSVTTGSQTVQYVSSLAGVTLWLTDAELSRVASLRGPAIG